MWLCNYEIGRMVSFGDTDCLYVDSFNRLIKTDEWWTKSGSTGGIIVGDYETREHAKLAMRIIVGQMISGQHSVVRAPSDKEIEKALEQERRAEDAGD